MNRRLQATAEAAPLKKERWPSMGGRGTPLALCLGMPIRPERSHNEVLARQSQAKLKDNPQLRALLADLLDGARADPQAVVDIERLAGRVSLLEKEAIVATFGAIDVLYNVEPKTRAALDAFVRRTSDARKASVYAIAPAHQRTLDWAYGGLTALGLASMAGVWMGVLGGGAVDVAGGFMSPAFGVLLATTAGSFIADAATERVRPTADEVEKRGLEYGRTD